MKDKLLKLSALTLSLSASLSSMPVMAQDLDGFKFWGYGRGGLGASDDRSTGLETDLANNGINIIQTAGNPYAMTGRLGNEGSWLEMHFDYGLNNNGMNWVAHINVASGIKNPVSDDLALDEWWVEGKGIFESNPGASLWVGKRYYNRFESMLNAYQVLSADGTGAGLDNFDLGFGKLNVGVTTSLEGSDGSKDFCDNIDETTWTCTGGKGWRGDYLTLSSRLHGIEIADDIKGTLFLNYGFYYGSDTDLKYRWSWGDVERSKKENSPNGFQVGFAVKQGEWADFNELVVRYSSKAGSSMTQSWHDTPKSQLGAYFQGFRTITDAYSIQYLWGTEIASFDEETATISTSAVDKSSWNTFVLRNTYNWNERQSTQLELGYDMMDFEARDGFGDDGTNSSYKVTLSHNFHIGGGFWDRPVLRFFATYGKLDTETTIYNNRHGKGVANPDWEWRHNPYITETGKTSALTFGAMFEAWW